MELELIGLLPIQGQKPDDNSTVCLQMKKAWVSQRIHRGILNGVRITSLHVYHLKNWHLLYKLAQCPAQDMSCEIFVSTPATSYFILD